MSKWALWAAHRYVHAGAAEPRRVGPDGRLLQRPWRMKSLEAQRTASLVRAARPQPWWPRPLGVLCLGVACMFALDPVGPVPTNVAASSSARTGPRLASPAAIAASGAAGNSPRLAWWPGDASPPFTVVLLDAAYGEILRRDGIEATSWEPEAAFRAALAQGGTFHWYVLGDDHGRPLPSPLATVEIVRPGTSGGIVR